MPSEIDHVWIEFSQALRGFILKRVPDQTAVEDILQEVFIKIIKSIDHLEDRSKLRGWLYQITRNTIVDHFRRQEVHVTLPDALEEAADESASDLPISAGLAPCVRVLMNRLPAKYRLAVELTELEGLTQKEMGEKLGLSHSGAKSRAQRGKEMMRDLLLDCCSFEIDRRGNILDYQAKSKNSPDCCGKPFDCSEREDCD